MKGTVTRMVDKTIKVVSAGLATVLPRKQVQVLLSIATKMVSAPPHRGILQGGQQVSSTILMYTEKRGRGTILVAIESTAQRGWPARETPSIRLNQYPVGESRSGQSVTASDFGSNGPRFESGRGRCIESLDKALYSHCPKEKPSH